MTRRIHWAPGTGHWALLCLLLVVPAFAEPHRLPDDHRTLTKSTSYSEMQSFLKSFAGNRLVSISEAGKTTQGRSIYLVNLRHAGTPRWTILFYAQQHGDELSGKDALLYLIRDIVADPQLLPRDVDLWILPMMNPDGAEAGTRMNGAGADLNRDHMTLDQPETRALHEVVRGVAPDLAVDCHEFGRDSEGYRTRGWTKWPDITMDGLNNPLFHRDLIDAADRWIDGGAKAEEEAKHPFLRYWVGGTTPNEEQRHSSPDIDSAMNAIGAHGTLSFIIEAAARKDPEAIAKELGNRVDAYLVLLRHFVEGDGNRDDDVAALKAARTRPLPRFLPVNYFWANPAATVTHFPVASIATGETLEIPTANMMTDIVVKKAVATPLGYAIEPRAAKEFATLLDRHAIPWERVAEPRTITAEACTLVRVEDEFDEVYSRYEGRQIVSRAAPAPVELPAGTLYVPLTGPDALRAALLLEPAALYGLYQYPQYRKLAGEKGLLPILRVTAAE